jgi:hypothetical protein
MGLHAILLPPLGYLTWTAYEHSAIPSFLRAVLVWSLWSSSSPLTVVCFSRWLLCFRCIFLKPALPEQFPGKVWASSGLWPSSSICSYSGFHTPYHLSTWLLCMGPSIRTEAWWLSICVGGPIESHVVTLVIACTGGQFVITSLIRSLASFRCW